MAIRLTTFQVNQLVAAIAKTISETRGPVELGLSTDGVICVRGSAEGSQAAILHLAANLDVETDPDLAAAYECRFVVGPVRALDEARALLGLPPHPASGVAATVAS